jgi:hypothetical protein
MNEALYPLARYIAIAGLVMRYWRLRQLPLKQRRPRSKQEMVKT